MILFQSTHAFNDDLHGGHSCRYQEDKHGREELKVWESMIDERGRDRCDCAFSTSVCDLQVLFYCRRVSVTAAPTTTASLPAEHCNDKTLHEQAYVPGLFKYAIHKFVRFCWRPSASSSRERGCMTVRGAPVMCYILKPKPTWSPSISQSRRRNPLPPFSQVEPMIG
ncbi:hypothetical protein H4582DRAFT_2010949 [Lactarius indigo]|nr:hypothetical protein H4582DRAFT_2010949 [Lactarius indigo]